MNQWSKDVVTWTVGDTLYISVPFTWQMARAERLANEWRGKALIGGPGTMTPNECYGFEPILFHNPCATVTTRGCPNSCGFCAVSNLEPQFYEIPDYRPAPVICDNNFTAASIKHQEHVVEKQKQFRLTDFNQGLEAKRFTPELADLLGKLRCRVRFAFDYWGCEGELKRAVDLCRARTTKDIRVYCLTGYNDTPESARARLELVRSWGILPTPMRYQPRDARDKNDYLLEGWTEKAHADMMRFYSRQVWFGHLPFDQYNRPPKEQLELLL